MTVDDRFTHVTDDPFGEFDPFDQTDGERDDAAGKGIRPPDMPPHVKAPLPHDLRASRRDEQAGMFSFEEALARAFERMGPSKEAEQRMLAALTAAEGARRHAGAAAQTAGAATPRRQRQAWRFAVPIAACLVLLVGVGAWALGSAASPGAGSMAASSGELASIKDVRDPQSTQTPAPGSDAEAAPSDEGASEGSSQNAGSSSGATSGNHANGNLVIELSTGQRLRYALDDANALRPADPVLVGAALESAFVDDGLGTASRKIPCTVYAYSDAAYPYAVRTEGSATYYLAVEIAS